MASLFSLPPFDPSNPASTSVASGSGDAVRMELREVTSREAPNYESSAAINFEFETSGATYWSPQHSFFTIRTRLWEKTGGVDRRVDNSKQVGLAPNFQAGLWSSISIYCQGTLIETIDDPAQIDAFLTRTGRTADWHHDHQDEIAWDPLDLAPLQPSDGVLIQRERFTAKYDENFGRTINTHIFRPPLSIWQTTSPLPSAKWRITLVPHQDRFTRAIHTLGQTGTFTRNPSNQAADDGATEYRFEIQDVVFQACEITGGDAASAQAFNGSFRLDLRRTHVTEHGITAKDQRIRFQVPPSTFRLSFGVRVAQTPDTRTVVAYTLPVGTMDLAGANIPYYPVQGAPSLGYPLTSLQMLYAGQSWPKTPLAINDYQLTAGLAGDGENGLIKPYYDHVNSIGAADISTESFEAWKRRGPLFTAAVVKPSDNLDTEVEVIARGLPYSGAGQFPNQLTYVAPHVAVMYSQSHVVIGFVVAGGQITQVIRSEG